MYVGNRPYLFTYLQISNNFRDILFILKFLESFLKGPFLKRKIGSDGAGRK